MSFDNIDKSLRWYLSGPMAGYPEHNFPAFIEASSTLRQSGLIIVSPHETIIDDGVDPFDPKTNVAPGSPAWRSRLVADITEMLTCQGIILMQGWTQSTGARIEFNLANSLYFQTYFYVPDGPALHLMDRRLVPL